MSRSLFPLLLVGACCMLLPAWAQPPGLPQAPPSVVVTLSAAPNPSRNRLLKHQLFPEKMERTPGNAAIVWMRASRAAAVTKPKFDEVRSGWLSEADTPLRALPRADVQEFLDKYASTLRLADEAARKSYCDWDLPPLTLQNLATYTLDDLQACREVASLLSLRCRLQLSKGDFDAALQTLQTGFALARDAGQGDTLVQELVGIAIGSLMLARVQEFIQLPDAPNLYWALTMLPQPLVELRGPLQSELNTLYRSFPALQKLDASHPLPDELETQLARFFTGEHAGDSDFVGKLGLAAVVLKVYPDAKRWLIAQGQPEEAVAKLPALQVVLLQQLDEYDRVRDQIVSALALPPWQATEILERVERNVRAARAGGVLNLPLQLLLPAISKVYDASLRLQYNVATLRAAEALRWYAATHTGQVPPRWTDITEPPPVVNPLNGKGFEAYYRVQETTAILEVPPLPRAAGQVTRRFELKAAPYR